MATEAAYSYGMLAEQAQEDALHATRLLNVEEKHFHRVVKTLLASNSPLKTLPRRLDGDSVLSSATDDEIFNRQKFRDEVLLDFASLESSIRRIQLIQSSNERERQRYAAEKAKILETAQAVRDNSVDLRAQLEEAQRVLELRKGYDELAMKVLSDKNLKSRDESLADIEKLEKEIEDLQHESGDYEDTWFARKEQFEQVVAEGEVMVKLIKGIKIDPERPEDENMEDDDEEQAGESRAGTPPLRNQTPIHEGTATPLTESNDAGESIHPAKSHNKLLDVDSSAFPSTRGSQEVASPTPSHGDVDMADSSANADAVPALEVETMDES